MVPNNNNNTLTNTLLVVLRSYPVVSQQRVRGSRGSGCSPLEGLGS